MQRREVELEIRRGAVVVAVVTTFASPCNIALAQTPAGAPPPDTSRGSLPPVAPTPPPGPTAVQPPQPPPPPPTTGTAYGAPPQPLAPHNPPRRPQSLPPHASEPAPNTSADPPAESPRWDWNFGAGITANLGSPLGSDLSRLTPGVAYDAAMMISAPTYSVSLERRLGSATWLLLGGLATYTAFDTPIRPSQGPDRLAASSITAYGGLVGIRQVVASGIVDVSLWATLNAGRVVIGGDALAPDERTNGPRPGSSATALALAPGLAVERELVEALAIRLSAQLGAVSYAHGDEVVVDDTTNQEGHEKTSSWNLGLWVAPGLQVRLYF